MVKQKGTGWGGATSPHITAYDKSPSSLSRMFYPDFSGCDEGMLSSWGWGRACFM